MASRPAVIELTGRDAISNVETSNVETQVRRRGPGRLDGLMHLVPETPPVDHVYPNIIIDIACQVIWINTISLNTLREGFFGFPQIISRLDDQYRKLLTEEEINFSDWLEGLYEPRMRSEIMNYVMTLTLEKTMMFINDHRPSQFYGDVLRILITRYQALLRAVAAADKNPDAEIPKHYDWCETKQEYLSQLSVDLQVCRHQLVVFLKIIEALLELIRRGAETSCLTNEHLKSLRIKMEALEIGYPTAFSALYNGLEPKQNLINKASENWWEVDITPKRRSSRVRTSAHLNHKIMQSSLNFIVPVVLLLSIIPAALAWTHGTTVRGTSGDSDFYQAIAGSLLQMLGIVTFIWPTLSHPRLSLLSWFWIWIAAGFSVLCALSSVLLYLYLPSTTWSFIIAFSGAVAQAVVQLQVINSI
ncbi:uncharacterized protein TRIVIDRAFT_221460 [Trichoderma virens Gv29-8]|uniref:Uncharacterized protein n=1 Tax=Hypocrea virens (strain Gv29-8 / FGSC 10586) TaxID=413071 RepID=G9MSG1_HYPVG|nr:uncharacterized protein TRIVIDRAFT_221460 [Trichoderma virens Gv29-8]EHK22177.1 hypothetical protein TRIVIDRAFT_221460 [Trichoderma virens Gv29-8]UKZ47213.1 hypothetical protein TrVGV298_001429 [Trichoderma virens]